MSGFTWITRNEKISIFRSSWQGLESISQLEYCDKSLVDPQVISKAAAQFESLKQSLNGSINLENSKYKENQSGHEEVCKGRLPDEPMFHFRYRLAKRVFEQISTSWESFNLSENYQLYLDYFKYTKNTLKTGAARLAESLWVLLQTGEKQNSFHQVWIENLIPSLERPTASELATALISASIPSESYIQKLIQFLLPEIERWKSDPANPTLLSLPERGFCQKAAIDPTITPQLKSVWNHLRLFYQGCDRRRLRLGKMPAECAPEKLDRILTIACIERTSETLDNQKTVGLKRDSMQINWPELPASLHFSTETLQIPLNYFEGDPRTLAYRTYRLAYAVENTLLNTQNNQLGLTENSLSNQNQADFDRPQMLTGTGFELIRLEILENINPFGANDLPTELHPYFLYDRFNSRIERFQGNFNRNLHKIKGELE